VSGSGVWYAGSSPQGLFRSENGGDCWEPVAGLNDHAVYGQWLGWVENGTPESHDRGATWQPLVRGLEVVEQLDAGRLEFHDPHCVRLSSADPDRLYQQNHCGICRLDRPGEEWVRIGHNMPRSVGDVGFPMDGSGVWPRTSPEARPAAYRSRNGGSSWQRLDAGLPRRDAWWTVKRQAMCADARDPVGLYFGTTSGEVWMSRDEGERWSCIARRLPEIHAVETGGPAR